MAGKKEHDLKSKKEPIRLFNTMGMRKELFKPLTQGLVRMYSCGPTVYDYAHIGHFRAYIFVDALKRMLKFNSLKVRHVMNITDVGHLTSDADTGEDKIEKKAHEEGKSAWEIAEFYTKDFFSAMVKLNVERPDIVCKATDYIKEMIEFIKKIEEKGYVYRTADGIYFDTSRIKDYGKLAGMSKEKAEDLKPGARIQFSAEKRNVTDFALWKFSPKDSKRQMEWPSPWGTGFPGWHIECSVMSIKYLGDTFDIHTGGIDHISIHHTNEIAQDKAVTGKEPVQFWMHNDFVMVDGEKMSKSKKNFFTMADIVSRGFNPLALRYLFLTAHYRSKVNFTWESLKAAETAVEALHDYMLALKKGGGVKTKKERIAFYESEFLKAINDDLNTSEALKTMWALIRDEKEVSGKDKLALILKFDELFGLGLKNVKAEKAELPVAAKKLIEEREAARRSKDFAKSDAIRKRLLEEFNVSLEDTDEGVKWKTKKK